MGALMTEYVADTVDIRDFMGGRKEARNDAPSMSVPLLTMAELREQAQAVRWVVKGAIPAESVGVLFGGSGTFKSFIAIDAACHIAHGLKWLGRRTTQGPVIFIAAEGGAGLYRRLEAWHQARGIKIDAAPIYVVPVAVDLASDAFLVAEAARRIGITPQMVVVDTLSQTFSGEENSATEMAAYLRTLGTEFRAVWQCAVLVVHHSGHNATDRPRGSSAIRANVDWMYGVFRDEKEMLATMECQKQKDGDPPTDEAFQLTVRELGTDEDGDPITSLVAKRVGSTVEVEQIMHHEASRGRGGRNHLMLELALNGMEERALRKAFYEAIDGDADSKRQAYFRALKWAKGGGFIEVVDGYILRPNRA